MSKMKLADYVFQRIKDAGVEYTFGIPGDFVLPHYVAQERSGLKTVVMTHEPSVGFAADAYARVRGLGVALVTYGAGGLNMINPVALAYAEESPVLVISGSPETRNRLGKPQLHHCVKSFDTQLQVFREVTESQALVTNPITAQDDIDRVLEAISKFSRPGYLEIPRDMVNCEIEVHDRVGCSIEGSQTPALMPGSIEEFSGGGYACRTDLRDPAGNAEVSLGQDEAVAEILQRLNAARQPVLFVGVEIRRYGLGDKVVALAESLNLPVVTSILGKASFPETHPNFIGNYFGLFGNPKVREYVEASDCVFCLGTVLTEMETAGYTACLEPEYLIQATAREAAVGDHTYFGIDLSLLVKELLEQTTSKLASIRRFNIPIISPEEVTELPIRKELTVAGMIEDLNQLIGDRYAIVADVGDCLYAGMSLKTNMFIAPGYYSSMGFGVPASIGAYLADSSRRPIVLVGDGGFQMTGMEISTAVKLGLNPIVVVFNNACYAMLKFLDQKRDYYNLPSWDYAQLAKAVGGLGVRASTRAEFQQALSEAEKSKELYLIDAVISPDDISPTLKRLTDHFGKKIKAAIS